MIKTHTSGTGFLYATAGNKRLHSSYDPVKEADRFLEKKITGTPGIVLILGPGLNYLRQKCRQKYPHAKILCVYYNRDFFFRTAEKTDRDILFSDPDTLFKFFHSHIGESDVEGLSVVEWYPVAELFPEISLHVNAAVRNFVQQLHGNFMTTDQFGRRWILNAVRNLLYHRNHTAQLGFSRPVLVVASGPRAEKGAGLIREFQDLFHIVALPSSLSFLYHHDIRVDYVISSDPGFYAGFHNTVIHRTCSEQTVLLRSISSSFSSSITDHTTLFFGSGGSFETFFLNLLYTHPVLIPPNGTVAGTSFELFDSLTHLPLLFVGLDFEYEDLLSHARPHPFYTITETLSDRTQPLIHLLYSRKRDFMNNSTAFETYSNWFRGNSARHGGLVYRLIPSSVSIPGMTELDSGAFRGLCIEYKKNSYPLHHIDPGLISVDIHEKLSAQLIKWINGVKGSSFDHFSDTYTAGATSESVMELLFLMQPITFKLLKQNIRNGNVQAARKIFSTIKQEGIHFFENTILPMVKYGQ